AAPLFGITFADGLAIVVIRLFRRHTPTKVNHEFKRLQLVSSFFYSVTHGTNDAQKGMGIITLILVVAAIGPPWGPPSGQFAVPFWVILGAHASISLGTFFGGWRIVRKMNSTQRGRSDDLRLFSVSPAAGTSLYELGAAECKA